MTKLCRTEKHVQITASPPPALSRSSDNSLAILKLHDPRYTFYQRGLK